jgi:mRNA interferase RelE/StbE
VVRGNHRALRHRRDAVLQEDVARWNQSRSGARARSLQREGIQADPASAKRAQIYEEKAIGQAAGFIADDPPGLGAALDAVDRLAGDPRPARSFPYGSPDLRRLRAGRDRVMYEIKGDVVSIWHVIRGKTSG